MTDGGSDALRGLYGASRPSPRRLLENHVFWDSDVLVCFAQIGRSQLIRAGFAGRSDLAGAVHGELRGLSQTHADVAQLLEPDCFASIQYVTREEAERAAEHQRAWVGRENWLNDPRWHRGEAESLRLVLRAEFSSADSGRPAPLVVHDRDARNAARPYGIDTYSCVEVLVALAVAGQLLPENAWDRWRDMVAGGAITRLADWTTSDDDRTRFLRLVEICGDLRNL